MIKAKRGGAPPIVSASALGDQSEIRKAKSNPHIYIFL